MTHLLRHSLVLLAGITTLLLGCSPSKKQVETPLRLGAMSSMDYIPYVVAERLGIYDSLGLNLELVKFFSANDRDAALRSGQIDGTVIDYTGAAIQHAAGTPLEIITRHDGYFELMAHPKFQTISELRGNRLSVSRNTVIDYCTDLMLRSVGLSEQDIEKLEVNKIPLRMEMMVAGEIEASVFPDPFITISRHNGFKSLCSSRDLGITITGTVMRREVLEHRTEDMRLLLQGYNLAVDYLQSTPRNEWEQILIEEAGIPEELVNEVVLPEYHHAALPSATDIEQTIAWLRTRDLVPADYKGAGLVNGSFLPMQ